MSITRRERDKILDRQATPAVPTQGRGGSASVGASVARRHIPPQRLVLPIPPSVNGLYATVRGHRVKSEKGRAYATTVALLSHGHGIERMDGLISVTIDVYRPRRAGDLDNYVKALLDSMKGIAWADDEQVHDIHARRFEDKENPRVELEIRHQ